MNTRQFAAAASAFALALALSGCGSPEESATPEGEASASAAPADAPSAAPSEAPSGAPSDAPSAAPSASPSASAAPTQAAAAPSGPPAAFAQCGVCHSTARGQNMIGPSLAGVAGRQSGSVSGFTYTDGMKNLNVAWNDSNLDRYLANPSGMVPGTTMAISPLNAADRRAIIAYLKTL